MTDGGRLRFAACAVVVLAGLVFRFDGYPLLDPDEGRNAEVAREMAASDDYLLPRLDGLPYPDKPLLFFAAGALAMELAGPTAFAARLPSLLFTAGTLILVWWLGRRWFGEPAGWIAAIATAASPLTLAFARTVIFDSTLTFFVVLAVSAFHEAAESAGRRVGGSRATGTNDPPTRPTARGGGAEWWPALAWASIALGVLTKGPIALGLPLMIAIPYLVWRKAWKALVDPVGLLLFLAIVLPWVRYMSERVPGYLRYVLLTETFQRLTTPALQRIGPWWYFTPILLLGALPWSVVALGNIRRVGGSADRQVGGSAGRRIVLLLLWIIAPLVFFSLSQSKRPQYVLPLVPAIGLLVGSMWTERGAKTGGVALAVIGAAILLVHGSLPPYIHSMTPQVASAVGSTAIPLGLICATSGAVAFGWSARADIALLALSFPTAAIPVVSGRLMNEIGRDRSAAELARAIQPALSQETEVVGVRAYPLSLPFYLNRTITLSTDSAGELTSNYVVRHVGILRSATGSPLRPADWWREAAIECERPRVFVIRSSDNEARTFLAERLALLGETGKYAAYGPCGMGGLATGGTAGGR
ncbi:MAG: glycosyltransferase family 39 protein, partial [Gemmatimonadetes bacterium]|nr:glycosyltransferase family 39 protein [Gemmatimonadota bacterium]